LRALAGSIEPPRALTAQGFGRDAVSVVAAAALGRLVLLSPARRRRAWPEAAHVVQALGQARSHRVEEEKSTDRTGVALAVRSTEPLRVRRAARQVHRGAQCGPRPMGSGRVAARGARPCVELAQCKQRGLQ